jgi:hypothetical protein
MDNSKPPESRQALSRIKQMPQGHLTDKAGQHAGMQLDAIFIASP